MNFKEFIAITFLMTGCTVAPPQPVEAQEAEPKTRAVAVLQDGKDGNVGDKVNGGDAPEDGITKSVKELVSAGDDSFNSDKFASAQSQYQKALELLPHSNVDLNVELYRKFEQTHIKLAKGKTADEKRVNGMREAYNAFKALQKKRITDTYGKKAVRRFKLFSDEVVEKYLGKEAVADRKAIRGIRDKILFTHVEPSTVSDMYKKGTGKKLLFVNATYHADHGNVTKAFRRAGERLYGNVDLFMFVAGDKYDPKQNGTADSLWQNFSNQSGFSLEGIAVAMKGAVIGKPTDVLGYDDKRIAQKMWQRLSSYIYAWSLHKQVVPNHEKYVEFNGTSTKKIINVNK